MSCVANSSCLFLLDINQSRESAQKLCKVNKALIKQNNEKPKLKGLAGKTLIIASFTFDVLV